MAKFEVLYGRKCRTPLNWSETGERQHFGPDIIQDVEEKVHIIRENLKAAQSWQKSYYDSRHHGMAYAIGDRSRSHSGAVTVPGAGTCASSAGPMFLFYVNLFTTSIYRWC